MCSQDQLPDKTPSSPETESAAVSKEATASPALPDATDENATDPSPLSEGEERSAFLRALRSLKPEEIPLNAAPAEQEVCRPGAFFAIRVLLIVICSAILLYSCGLLVQKLRDSMDSDDVYSDLSNQFWGNAGNIINAARPDFALPSSPDYAASQGLTNYDDFIGIPSYNERFEQIKARLNALKEINAEIYGYIYIEDTKVDYPLVQHSDNNYYLKHDFTGKYSGAGSIFVDYRNSAPLESNRNTILYGHHMSSGSTMFHTLDYYFDKSFFDTHPDIYIYTFDGIYRFKVFAVYITDENYRYISTSFASDDSFVAFCEEMLSNSIYTRDGVTFDKNSRLLTLSTCTNIVETERICIQAVLEEIEI